MVNQKDIKEIMISNGTKGVGKSYLIEKEYKDYFKIETPKSNKQHKQISNLILEGVKINEKILVRTNFKFMKNSLNRKLITECNIPIAVLIEDLGINFKLSTNMNLENKNSKLNFKNTEAYKLIKNKKNE